MPPPPHIKKAFDLKWYKVTRRALKGQGTWVYYQFDARSF
jgi:hypothetical protein